MGKGRHHIGEEIVCTTRNSREYVGEQDAQELDECLLNPETRNVVQIVVNDKNKSNDVIEMFMGKDTKDRKEYIALHSEEARI